MRKPVPLALTALFFVLWITPAHAAPELIANHAAAGTTDNLGNINDALGETFTTDGTTRCLTSAKFYVEAVGSPSGTLVAKLYATTGAAGSALPNGTALAVSDPLDAGTINGAMAQYEWLFDGTFELSTGTEYAIALVSDTDDGTDYWLFQDDHADSYASGNFVYSQDNEASWNSIGFDADFEVYADVDCVAPPPPPDEPTSLEESAELQNFITGWAVIIGVITLGFIHGWILWR